MDRNCELPSNAGEFLMSLSARRAWIEIRGGYITKIDKDQSLSARRAWIEITVVGVLATLVTGRSPQGERG